MSRFTVLEERGFVQGKTDVEVYQQFVRHGEEKAGVTFPVEIEHYLVSMLLVSVANTDTSRRLALILLDVSETDRALEQALLLHELGFEALKLASFFPGEVKRRRVHLSYVMEMARTGYGNLSQIDRARVKGSSRLQAFIPLGLEISQQIESIVRVFWFARDDTKSLLEYNPSGIAL